MAIGDLKEVRIVCTQGTQTSINIRHYEVVALAGTGASHAAMATALDAVWAPVMKACLCSTAQYRGVGIRHVSPPPPSVEDNTIASAGAGSVAGNLLPRQVCGLLSLRTAQPGKSGRGRFYVPFPSAASSDTDGTPTAAYNTLCVNLATVLLANVVAGGGGNTETLRPILWSRVTGQRNFITSTIVRDAWATQRRRGSFGRPNAAPF